MFAAELVPGSRPALPWASACTHRQDLDPLANAIRLASHAGFRTTLDAAAGTFSRVRYGSTPP